MKGGEAPRLRPYPFNPGMDSDYWILLEKRQGVSLSRSTNSPGNPFQDALELLLEMFESAKKDPVAAAGIVELASVATMMMERLVEDKCDPALACLGHHAFMPVRWAPSESRRKEIQSLWDAARKKYPSQFDLEKGSNVQPGAPAARLALSLHNYLVYAKNCMRLIAQLESVTNDSTLTDGAPDWLLELSSTNSDKPRWLTLATDALEYFCQDYEDFSELVSIAPPSARTGGRDLRSSVNGTIRRALKNMLQL